MPIILSKETLKKEMVDISISGNELRVSENSYEVSRLHFSEIHLKYGGAANRYLFIDMKRHPELSLYLNKKDPVAKQLVSLRPVENQKEHKKAQFTDKVTLVILGLLALLFCYAIFNVKTLASGLATTLISPSVERSIGDRLAPVLYPESIRVRDPKKLKDLNELISHVMTDEERKEIPVHLVKKSDPNAVALLGGQIFIHEGLVKLAETPEEVLAVLSHELAHVKGRHALKGVLTSIGLFGLVQLVLGDVSGIIAILADQGGWILSLSHTREFEVDADKKGLARMLNNKINVQAQADIFQKLLDSTGGLDSKIPALFKTHPKLKDRITAAQEAAKTQKDYKKVNFKLSRLE